MTRPHHIPETARLFLNQKRPHHALAAVVVLAIMQSAAAIVGAVITAFALLSK